MQVNIIAKTQLTENYIQNILNEEVKKAFENGELSETKAVSLTAIRTCYSHLKPIDIINAEFEKYFKKTATDGKGGKEADRLIRHIINSKHSSVLEHCSYNFAISGVSRSLLAQLTRHRVGVAFSVASQRYIRFGSNDKSGGASWVTPPSIQSNEEATELYNDFMEYMQLIYDKLRALGVPGEDARYVFSNGVTTNLTMTMNLSALLTFYSKRKKGRGAQWEIANFAELLKEAVIKEDAWLAEFFDKV